MQFADGVVLASAGEQRGLDDGAAVGDVPALGDRETSGVAAAEVVGVRITLAEQVVEPHLGPPVLVRQRDRRPFRAARPGAVTGAGRHGGRQYATVQVEAWIRRPAGATRP